MMRSHIRLSALPEETRQLHGRLMALMMRGAGQMLDAPNLGSSLPAIAADAFDPDAEAFEIDSEVDLGGVAPAETFDPAADAAPEHGALASDRRFRAYLAAVRQRARLDHAAERACFEQLAHGEPKLRAHARSQLIQSNLWVVPIVVRRFYKHGNGFEDLVAEGNLGLYRALERFDPARGLRFSTYAKWWVTHVVTAAMSANAYPVRVPRRIALQLARQRRAASGAGDSPVGGAAAAGGALADAGEAPTGSQLAPPPQLAEPLAESIEALEESGAAERADDSACTPEVMLALKQGLSLLREALEELPPRERLVIEARYGLAGQAERTLQDLGRELGMSAEGVRKVQLAAMERLKRKLASEWL